MNLSRFTPFGRRGGTVGTTLRAVAAAAAVFLLPPTPASALILDEVPYATVMWSPSDPFGFSVLSNVVTIVADNTAAHVALTNYTDIVALTRVAVNNGSSTNQSLYSATVTNKLSFGRAFSDALAAGEIAWDEDWMTFRAGVGDGVTGQFFQESHIYAKNVSGQTVTNGMAVRFSGVVGNSGKLEFTLALADGSSRASCTLGLATHDIADGALGKITWFGNVNAIDTTGALYGETAWSNNMTVYVSTNRPGFLTKHEPQAPQQRISVGAVINAHAQAGAILVRPTWGMKITEADDVDGTPLTASGQLMVWDQTRGVFDFTENVNRYATTNAVSAHTNRTDNPHGVTAAQTGAITEEEDLAALRLYHYGSTEIVESPASAFGFNPGTGEINSYDFEFGSAVVVPWSIDGTPVTTISSSVFSGASLLTSLVLPRSVVSISPFAFDYCVSLTAVTFSASAPAASPNIYANIPANQVTNYVTNPNATGWSSTFGGMPVVRLPLYADQVYENGVRLVPKTAFDGHVTGGTHTNVTLAGTVTIGGVARTDWPEGGTASPASVAALITASPTNVTVVSTQQVYEVTATGAGAVGINWSGVTLAGKRAEILLRLHVSEWGGTNVSFASSMTFDTTPEILVTGVWEFACSTVDGVTTRVRQTWPEAVECNALVPQVAVGGSASLVYGGNRLQTLGTAQDGVIQYYWPLCAADVVMVRIDAAAAATVGFPLGSFCDYRVEGYNVSISPITTNRCEITVSTSSVGGPVTTFRGTAKISEFSVSSMVRLRRLILPGDPSSTNAHIFVNAAYRELNANERAAYEAGWRP